jgi:hypothetical protein
MTKMQQAANTQLNPAGMNQNARLNVTNQLFAGGGIVNGGNPALPPPIDPIASVVSAASAAGLGELFQYTVGNVSIKRQQSAMIPIVTDDIDIKKVSIYNRNVLSTHPLNGVRLKNTTTKHLLAGPVTVIEAGSYAGDAKMDDVPPDERRLLSYGIDLKTNVVATDDPQPSSVQLASITRGVLPLQWLDFILIKYILTNYSVNDLSLFL